MSKYKKKKILIITGTRAEYGLFKTTILKLRRSRSFDTKLLVTGQHTLKKFGWTQREVENDMTIDRVVPIRENDDMMIALATEIVGIRDYMLKESVDAVIVIGDRDEPFAAAVVGLHMNIPVIHISGGDMSGPTVDHYLRNAITVFSKLHLVQTKKSKENVIRLGAVKKNVDIVGSVGLDGLVASALLTRHETAKQLGLSTKSRWYLVSMHPTPFDVVPLSRQMSPVVEALKKIDLETEKVVLYPNADQGADLFIDEIESLRGRKNYYIFKHLSRALYTSLLYHSEALIGNSSSGLMEAGFLKRPVVNVGNRQRGRERGANVIDVGYNSRSISDAIRKVGTKVFQGQMMKKIPVYSGMDVSDRIVRRIERFLNEYNHEENNI